MSDVQLSEKAKSLKLGRYRHYKDKYYQLIGVAMHSETLEELVVYLHEDKDPVRLWVRPLEMFMGEVEVDGMVRKRFEWVGP